MAQRTNPYDIYLAMPGSIVPAKSVAKLAPMTFLENLEVDEHSNVVMTSMLDGRIWRLPYGDQPELIAQIQGRPSSIASAPDEGWLVFGWTVTGTVAVFHVKTSGEWEIYAQFPDAIFPNGVQRLPNGHYLFADLIAGKVWDFDYKSRSLNVWYSHPLFGPKEGSWEPALNGLKIWNDRLYMSNSSKALFLSQSIKHGYPAGEPEIVLADIHADDFAFDTDGSVYLTTHPLDVVLKLTQSGELSRVAGATEGVRGCTACRFGRRVGDETGLYVVTDGGLFNPISGGLQSAQVVRLEIGVPGAPVDLH